MGGLAAEPRCAGRIASSAAASRGVRTGAWARGRGDRRDRSHRVRPRRSGRPRGAHGRCSRSAAERGGSPPASPSEPDVGPGRGLDAHGRRRAALPCGPAGPGARGPGRRSPRPIAPACRGQGATGRVSHSVSAIAAPCPSRRARRPLVRVDSVTALGTHRRETRSCRPERWSARTRSLSSCSSPEREGDVNTMRSLRTCRTPSSRRRRWPGPRTARGDRPGDRTPCCFRGVEVRAALRPGRHRRSAHRGRDRPRANRSRRLRSGSRAGNRRSPWR